MRTSQRQKPKKKKPKKTEKTENKIKTRTDNGPKVNRSLCGNQE